MIRTISDSQTDEIKSAPSEKTKTDEQFNQDLDIEALWRYEVGFSQVMQHLAKSKKPVVGHNVKFDLCFLYHQFFKELPETLELFAKSMNTEFLRACYDTKVLTLYAGHIPKSDLQNVFKKISTDKKYTNNFAYEPDEENPKQPKFSAYKGGG